MAAKRITPDVETLGQGRITTPQLGSANVVGAAGPPVGPSGLEQITRALGKVNPALQSFGYAVYDRKRQRSASEAKAYFEEIDKAVTDSKILTAQRLKKLGLDWHNNPEVYRQELINSGSNWAVRDLDKLASSDDFVKMMTSLSRTSPTNEFADSARQLIDDNFRPSKREADDPAVSRYFETGYGESWVNRRDAYIEKFAEVNQAQEGIRIRREFYTTYRNKLKTLLSQPSDKWETGFRDLRKFTSLSYAGHAVPAGTPFATDVMDNGIMPVLLELADDPNSDVNLEAAFTRIMAMTRDNGNGGRTKIFKEDSDFSEAGGVQTQTDLWNRIYDRDHTAFTKQNDRQVALQKSLTTQVQQALNNWPSFLENNLEWAEDNQVQGADPSAIRDQAKIATALASHPDFHLPPEVSAQYQSYMFSDAVEAARRIILQGDLAEYSNKADYAKAIIDGLTGETEDTILEYLAPSLANVKAAVGDPNLSKEQVQAAALKALNSAEVQANFKKKFPNLTDDQTVLNDVFKKVTNTAIMSAAEQEAQALMHTAQAAADNPDTDTEQLNDLILELQDAANEIQNPSLEKDLKATEDALNQARDFSPYYSISRSEITTLAKEGLNKNAETEFARLLAIAADKPRGDEISGMTMGSADDDEWAAVTSAYEKFLRKATVIWREEAKRVLVGLDRNERETQWSEGLEDKVKQRVAERLNAQRDQFYKDYQENMRLNPEAAGRLQQQENQFLTPEEQQVLEGMTDFRVELQNSAIYEPEEDKLIDTDVTMDGVQTPSHSIQFFTGPRGQQRYDNLGANKRLLKKRRGVLESSLYAAKGAFKNAETNGTLSEQNVARQNMIAAERMYKAHIKSFEGLDYTELMKDEGQTHTFTVKGGEESINFQIERDNINLENTLVYSSIDQLGNALEALNQWEAENGGADAEISPDTVPDDVKEHARFIKRVSSLDLTAKSPVVRQQAMQEMGRLAMGQASMVHVNHPDKLPQQIFQAIQDQAHKQYINSTRNTWQNIEYAPRVKEYVKTIFEYNQDILKGKYTVKDGISGKDYMELHKKYFGDPSKKQYTIGARQPEPLPLFRPKGYVDKRKKYVGMNRKFAGKPNDDVAFVLAQELALMDVGFSEVVTERGGYRERLEEITPTQEARFYKKFRSYKAMLDSSEKSSDLAQALNKLLDSEPAAFQHRFGVQNPFGLGPLRIPFGGRPDPFGINIPEGN